MRLDRTYTAYSIYSARSLQRVLAFFGVARTQLTTLTGTRTTAFAKPVAESSHMAVCNNPRVKSTEPQRKGMPSKEESQSRLEGGEGQNDRETRERESREREMGEIRERYERYERNARNMRYEGDSKTRMTHANK